MANYKASTLGGSSYQRAKELHINNPLAGEKDICFIEERVMNMDDGSTVTTQVPGLVFLRESFTAENSQTTFNVLDVDGEPTGATASYAEVYLLLQSLYYHLANQRDLQEI